jgi:DNA (cytosine-5)-methyltransferase 1
VAKPRLLDLYCGAGGASAGYALAGFQVTGVDVKSQPRYPFDFCQRDALEVLGDSKFLRRFQAIHASPPCQSETSLRHLHNSAHHPNLLGPTLDALRNVSLPWVVENVEATQQMPDSVILCGSMFGLGARCNDGQWRGLRRHRRFSSSIVLDVPACRCSGLRAISVHGGGGGVNNRRSTDQGRRSESAEAMAITWMTKTELNQAIPPAYTQFIGRRLIAHLKGRR